MNDIIVIDDAIPLDYQNYIEDYLCGVDFPWYFTHSAVWPSDESIVPKQMKELEHLDNVADHPQFFHYLFGDNQEWSNKNTAELSYKILSAVPYSIKNILRVKANYTYPHRQKNTISVPHVDFSIDNLTTAIYYVNDSDGDTYIFNEKYTGASYTRLTNKKVISAKKGRLVVFDGNRLHAGQCPINTEMRVVINFNLIPYKKTF